MAGSVLIYCVSAIIGLIIFYYVVKAAVKNGVLQASEKLKSINSNERLSVINDDPLSQKQKELKGKYDKGEITFEEYQREWNT